MKRDCSTCICKEGSCYPSTTIFDKDKTCKSYDPDYEGYIAELEKENAELKEKMKELKCCGNCQTVRNAEGVCYFLKDGTCNPRTRIKWVQKNDSKILEKQYPMI